MLPEIECIGYVGKALDITRDGLAPFIEAQLKRRCPDTWRTDLSSLFTSSTEPIDANNPPWDSYHALKALTVQSLWERVFSFCMSPTHRGYAFELSRLRNKQQAHGQVGSTLTEEDAHRSLDNAVLLLTAIRATKQTAEAVRLRSAVRRAIAVDEESPTEPNDQPASFWSCLLLRAVASTAIRIVPIKFDGSEVATRALGPMAAKENFERIPRFAQTDSVRMELDLKLAGIDMAQPLYCLCLVVDAEQVTCLCPHPVIAPDPRVRWPFFQIPVPKVKEPLAFYGATGDHVVYVVLTKAKLPAEIYEILQAPQPIEVLDTIAAPTIALSDSKILKTEFVVV